MPRSTHHFSVAATGDRADGDKVPTVGNKSTYFSGFLETPVRRPLLATTGRRIGT
jgi:hypothetical protein